MMSIDSNTIYSYKNLNFTKIFFTGLILFASFCCSYAQKFDTVNVLLNAKLKVLELKKSIINAEDVNKVLIGNCNYKFLSSKGFENVVFFEVILSYDSLIHDSLDAVLNYSAGYAYNFVFGYNTLTNNLYKLKGFVNNDFGMLYNYLILNNDQKLIESKRHFINYFHVEHLDLECLFDWHQEYISKRRFNLNYDCIKQPSPLFDGISW